MVYKTNGGSDFFAGEDSCSCRTNAKVQPSSTELTDRIAAILDDNPDPALAVTVLALISAVTCRLAAEDVGTSVGEQAGRFMREFQRIVNADQASSVERRH